jgi:hypothetical protein
MRIALLLLAAGCSSFVVRDRWRVSEQGVLDAPIRAELIRDLSFYRVYRFDLPRAGTLTVTRGPTSAPVVLEVYREWSDAPRWTDAGSGRVRGTIEEPGAFFVLVREPDPAAPVDVEVVVRFRPALTLAAATAVNDPALQERGPELRAALAKELQDQGFDVRAGGFLLTTSIDYTPWTALAPSSLYVTARVEGLDEVSVQRLNEGFDAAALARDLAQKLAASPRLTK